MRAPGQRHRHPGRAQRAPRLESSSGERGQTGSRAGVRQEAKRFIPGHRLLPDGRGLGFGDLSSLKGFWPLVSTRLFQLLGVLRPGTVTLQQETPEVKVTKEAADSHRPETALPGAHPLDDPAWYKQSKARAPGCT